MYWLQAQQLWLPLQQPLPPCPLEMSARGMEYAPMMFLLRRWRRTWSGLPKQWTPLEQAELLLPMQV
ncbi:hypothetical protein [Mumia zhuanghuii]|uniref:Uncharacterized protein n=1 Tax=Mumia zhuanghuii TaxID=2585211 RepID=A0A5C4M5C3_9ACTN|nr:hypothetical protein [Mumia zhuanghuii]TNC28434.1 hypothetical protein FHE65_33990 [Mumia zhuanghuii]